MATFARLPSGKWRAQVRRGGVSKSQTFETKTDAQTWAGKIEAQAVRVITHGHATPKGATIGWLVDQYLQAIPVGRSTGACLRRLSKSFAKTKPEALPFALSSFIDRRQADGAGGVTISQDLSALATALDWAHHVKKIDVDSAVARKARAGLKHRKLNTRSNERERTPTAKELDTLRDYWASNSRMEIPMAQLMDFAIASAMRLGEICRIAVKDVDREARTVIIRDRKDPRRKLGNHQKVPLLPDAWAIVEPLLAVRKTGRLFPLNPRSVSAAFTRATARCGIVDLHFHDLRHEGATRLFRMGLSIELVALITGHKSWENLRRYTNLTAADVHKAVANG